MAGCDYLPSVRSVGFKTVVRLLANSEQSAVAAFLAKRLSSAQAAAHYMRQVDQALLAYRHPLVYDDSEGLSHLTAPADMDEQQLQQLDDFVGPKFNDFKRFCQGELDVRTLEPRGKVSVDFGRVTAFLNFVPKIELGRLNNLCSTQVTFDNFDELSHSDEDRNSRTGDQNERGTCKRVKL